MNNIWRFADISREYGNGWGRKLDGADKGAIMRSVTNEEHLLWATLRIADALETIATHLAPDARDKYEARLRLEADKEWATTVNDLIHDRIDDFCKTVPNPINRWLRCYLADRAPLCYPEYIDGFSRSSAEKVYDAWVATGLTLPISIAGPKTKRQAKYAEWLSSVKASTNEHQPSL